MNKHRIRSLIIGFFITAMVIAFQFFPSSQVQSFLERVEGIIYDARLVTFLPQNPREIEEHIVIVDIDEASMAEQGRYPWSRRKMSELVEQLMSQGVVLVGFDIVFAENEVNPVSIVLKNGGSINEEVSSHLAQISPLVDADIQFAKTLSKYDTVTGFMMHQPDERVTPIRDSRVDTEPSTTNKIHTASLVEWSTPVDERSHHVTQFSKMLQNIAALQSSATGAGFINSVPDSDGFIRKASLFLSYQDILYPSLALEMARVYTLADDIKIKSVKASGGQWVQGFTLNNVFIPTNEKGQVLIPFKGPQRSFDYISATDILNKRISDQRLEGAIVFIGTSAIGLSDLRATSVGIQYPGVEVHANVLEGILHPEIIPIEPDTSDAIIFLLLLLTGIVLSLAMVQKEPFFIVLTTISATVFHIMLNGYLWYYQQVSLPVFTCLLLTVMLAGYFGLSGFIIEKSRRRNIKSMFDQYVPSEYIDQLIQSSNSGGLSTERREMSVLFADIRNFTALSETLTPSELAEFMNEYLTEITKVIFDNQGTIDKYVGDMVMAFWNAPLEDNNHQINAVKTAMAMVAKVKEISPVFLSKGWPEVTIGVGINSGDMNVGDMGSNYRKAYTVLGDNVNLGSRLESLTKFYGVDILIGENTFNALTDKSIVCRQIDTITVKGKSTAVTVYEPITDAKNLTVDELNLLAEHQLAIDNYLAKNWQVAKKQFIHLKEKSTWSVRVYDEYLNRISYYESNSVPNDWNGVFSHLNK